MKRRERDDQPELPANKATATATAELEASEVGAATPETPANGDGTAKLNEGDVLSNARQAGRNEEFFARLKEIHDCKIAAKAEVADIMEDLKAAKGRLQSVQDDEDKLLAAYLYNTMPLFDKPAANGQAASAEAAPDLWRAVPIREALAGLPASLYERLEEAEITTMGAYADYCQKNASLVDSGEHPLRKITGIGPKKVEEIQAAEEAFWKLWKERPMVPHEDTANEDKYHFDAGDEDRYGQYKYDYTADGQ